jgi:hypothetical protein
MLLWMMFPLAIWGGTDKTGSFDLWKAMAMPWMIGMKINTAGEVRP